MNQRPRLRGVYIEKQRVRVRIAQQGRDPLDGYFCLIPGDETVLELLNAPVRVIPFIVLEDAAVRLITRLNLDWVIAGEQSPLHLVHPRAAGMREEPIEIEFLNGTTMDGLMQLARNGRRPSDFLNDEADYFPVRTRLGTLLVNKNRVLETRLVVAPAKPAGTA